LRFAGDTLPIGLKFEVYWFIPNGDLIAWPFKAREIV
jgi:hypothetical protein